MQLAHIDYLFQRFHKNLPIVVSQNISFATSEAKFAPIKTETGM